MALGHPPGAQVKALRLLGGPGQQQRPQATPPEALRATSRFHPDGLRPVASALHEAKIEALSGEKNRPFSKLSFRKMTKALKQNMIKDT